MKLEINEQERELLVSVLKAEHTSLLNELHHTDSYDFKQMLKEKDELLKDLRARLEDAGGEKSSVGTDG